MGFQVIFAPQAIKRLQAIVAHVTPDNPSAALRLGTRLIDHAMILSDFPDMGMPYRQRAGIRRLSCRPYFIYYRVHRRRRVVEIMDFWHTARRDPNL